MSKNLKELNFLMRVPSPLRGEGQGEGDSGYNWSILLVVILFFSFLFISCGGENKNSAGSGVHHDPLAGAPTGSVGSAGTQVDTGSGGGSMNSQKQYNKKSGFPTNIDERGNRLDAGAYAIDPCQDNPPGPGCDLKTLNE